MNRTAFRQADMQRIFRAAKSEGMAISIDIRTLVVTAIPDDTQNRAVDRTKGSGPMLTTGNGAPYGKENWDED